MRLCEDRFDPKSASTLGMRLWRLPADKVDPASATEGEKRRFVLWISADRMNTAASSALSSKTLALL